MARWFILKNMILKWAILMLYTQEGDITHRVPPILIDSVSVKHSTLICLWIKQPAILIPNVLMMNTVKKLRIRKKTIEDLSNNKICSPNKSRLKRARMNWHIDLMKRSSRYPRNTITYSFKQEGKLMMSKGGSQVKHSKTRIRINRQEEERLCREMGYSLKDSLWCLIVQGNSFYHKVQSSQ